MVYSSLSRARENEGRALRVLYLPFLQPRKKYTLKGTKELTEIDYNSSAHLEYAIEDNFDLRRKWHLYYQNLKGIHNISEERRIHIGCVHF